MLFLPPRSGYACFVALSAASIGAAARADGPPLSLHGMGDLPGGFVVSMAHAISADGTTVVGTSDSDLGVQAFRWTLADGIQGIGDIPGDGFRSEAFGVSQDGSFIVGRGISAKGGEAFRWAGGDPVGLGDLPGGIHEGQGRGVSYDGSTVVGWSQSNIFGQSIYQAFRWTQESGMVSLGTLSPGRQSLANAISGDGRVVVGQSNSERGAEVFRWTAEDGMVALGDLPGGAFSSQALGVSSDGSVIVGSGTSEQGTHAFRWTQPTGFVQLDLEFPVTSSSEATGVSADGSVLVGWATPPMGNSRAFVWTEFYGLRYVDDVLRESGVDLSGWSLDRATGVSADGLFIVGIGTHNGFTEGWIAAVPAPTTAVLLPMLCLSAMRRRR